MIWTRSLVTLVLLVSTSRFGHSRALTAVSRSHNSEICDDGASKDLFLGGPLANLLPRLDQIHDHDFNPFITHWSRKGRQLPSSHEARAVLPKVPNEPEPIGPTKPKPNSSGADPSDPGSSPNDPGKNPSAGLDPTRSGSTPTGPEDNPEAGLDPTKPKPSTDPSPRPSAASDPAKGGPNQAPDGDANPAAKPSPVTDAAGCGLKRSDEPCPGPSDNIGDDVPGEVPDTAASTRSNRPADDYAVEYDYLAEVVSERGTPLVNDKLEILRNRIATQAPDDPVRTDEINSKYTFDSKEAQAKANASKNRGGNGDSESDGESEDKSEVFEFEDVFNSALDHKQFKDLLPKAGVTLTDPRGEREALRSVGADAPVLKWSWSKDQKLSFTDWSYKKNDNSNMSPKPHYTELTMALFKEKGVDPKTIQAIGQTRIINDSTMKTIQSIFTSLKVPWGTDVVVISRSDTGQAESEAFDAYFRTANGKGTVNLLAFHANDWGFRQPQILVLQRAGMKSASFNTLVTLG